MGCALIRNPRSITRSICLYAVNNVVVSSSASVSPPSSTSNEAAPSIKTHSTPDHPSKSTNPLSTWFSPSQTENRPSKTTQGNKSTPVTEKSGSSSMFGSTWGASDSFWGSYFASPGSSAQGGGRGVKEAPKPTSMARGVGARRLKSQTSSSNKTQSSEQRKKVTSPRLTSPPKSSSTPLPQPKEKEKSSISESTRVESSSNIESGTSSSLKPEQVVTTPKNSSKSQSISKTLVKSSEAEEGEAGSSEGGTEVKAKKPSDQSLKSRTTCTPDLSEPVKDSNDAAILETTDSGSTAAENNALTVVEQTALMQEERNKQLDGSSPPLSTEDSKTGDVELTRKSSSPESPSSPTAAANSIVEEGTAQVPSQTDNSDRHSAMHRDAQHDSTDTQQTAVKQMPLTDQKLETKLESDSNLESKPREQDKMITNEQSHTENKELHTKATETKDSAVHQLQTPSSDRQTNEPERDQGPSSVAVQDKGEGERGQQPVIDEQNDESTPPKEKAATKESVEHPDIDSLKKVVWYMCMYMYMYIIHVI